MFIKDKDLKLKEIKEKLGFSDQEWRAFQEKQISLKPFNDKEWEAFQLISKEIDSDHMSIGVDFYIATLNQTQDGWKRDIQYKRLETTYNKFHRSESTKEIRVEPFGKTDMLYCCLLLIGIMVLILILYSFIINIIGWEEFLDAFHV